MISSGANWGQSAVRVEIKVSGIVQGVGFRPFIYRTAVDNGLVGFVRNRGDAHVEIVVEGNETSINKFLLDLKTKMPPLAHVHGIITNYCSDKNEFKRFTILKSSNDVELSGSVISPDVSICNQCVNELRNPKNERFDYFFITCTDCGPRFTVVETLPYDRSNTTMQQFKMCSFCQKEYSEPSNRRFHAQTVACPKCGPQVFLARNDGQPENSKDPIREAGKLLEEGNILAIKGYGGFHVATSTIRDRPLIRLRTVKHRSQKPFAIMARDLLTIKTFAEINEKESQLLTSYIKPIVLLQKSPDYNLSDLVAPGLHNIGVMLPYSALHFMLFDEVDEPAFVMTSANPPNEPIVTENEEAVQKLGNIVDYFLFHNRLVAQRCDDSVVRVHGENISLIRRSRGYAPMPIQLKWTADKCVLGMGAELNTTSCILLRDKAFISQHIGDVENLETLKFLKSATKHMLSLTNSKVEAVACDLHPKFTTTMLAEDWSSKIGCSIFKIQHHHAHAAALMAEYGLDEIVAAVCDGYGYGLDGQAWGGEILHCNRDGGFQRLGHLEEQPLLGGDSATRYPLRMAAGILNKATDIEDWLLSNRSWFSHGKEEVELILQQLSKGSIPATTSCGRVLDAVSAVLGISFERTYEGEPAMKLESAAVKGRDVLKLEPIIKDNVLNTTALVNQIFDRRNDDAVSDLAFSAQNYLAEGLAQIAVKEARRLGIDVVGFSGGVAYNEHIVQTIRKVVEGDRLRLLVHELVPTGDGGVSLGQAVAAGWQGKH
jgi:hydrogenase maturation protein HypF